MSLTALTLACAALAPASAGAAASPPGDGDLSARLAELAHPAVRSASRAAQGEALSLAASGPGSLLREGNRVVAEVRLARWTAAAAGALRAAGAKVVNVSRRHRTITVAAKPDELKKLSAVPLVEAVTEVLTPIVSESSCPSGPVVSEGEQLLHAGDETGEARDVFGVDGSGVTVGVLSDSFGQASKPAVATTSADDVASGDLPGLANTCPEPEQQTPVEIVDDTDGAGADEGRAMAQIVHDLAPAANLAFATAFGGETAFAENIERLARPPAQGGAGAKVVVDDVAYPSEPFFQEGPVAVAVRKATEAGATYLSSAGNNNLLDPSENPIGSWEAEEFRDSGGCPPALQAFPELNAVACMDFNPGSAVDKTLGIKVPAGATLTVDLQWSESWGGVATDLDAFLLDATGEPIAASGEDNPEGSEVPLEFFQWKNTAASTSTVQLVVNRFSGGASPRLKVAFPENGAKVGQWGLEYPRSSGAAVGGPATDVVGPTLFGHNGAATAISVAAVPVSNPAIVEKYSSRGPVTHYFGPVEGELPLGSPEALAKPEITAVDCGQTSFFSFQPKPEPGTWRFCGTSASAPHAAAVAALMLEAEPAEPADIRAALLSGATELAGGDPCAVGTGLVDAVGAIEKLLTPPPEPLEPQCEAPEAEVEPDEARAAGDWGVESPPGEEPEPEPEPETGGSEPDPVTQDPAPAPEPAPTRARRPSTTLLRRPAKTVRTVKRSARTVFRFGSDQADVVFLCKFDRGALHRCEPRTVRRFGLGRHVLRVRARNAAGRVDPTPVLYRFRVARLSRTAATPLRAIHRHHHRG